MGDPNPIPSTPASKPWFLDTPFHLVLLSLTAGSADAVGYLGLGNIFTANMTGNIVLLGIALGQGYVEAGGRAAFSLLLFLIGTCLGAWLCHRATEKNTWTHPVTFVIGCEAALLLTFAAAWEITARHGLPPLIWPLIALLSLSMGLQGAAAYRLGVPGVVTTVVTGTLTSLLTGLMKPVPVHPESHRSPHRLQAFVIIAYGIGAIISGFLVLHATPCAGLFPTLIVLVVVLTRSIADR